MNTTLPTVETLAAEVNAALVRDKRNDGKEFIKLADGSPEWMTDLCRTAHGDMMPDDWRYEFIEDALSQIENGEEQIKDVGSAYPYTTSRTDWLASRVDRFGYCDDAAEEYEGEGSLMDRICWGMDREMNETFDLVKTFLEERVTELEDEAEGAAEND